MKHQQTQSGYSTNAAVIIHTDRPSSHTPRLSSSQSLLLCLNDLPLQNYLAHSCFSKILQISAPSGSLF